MSHATQVATYTLFSLPLVSISAEFLPPSQRIARSRECLRVSSRFEQSDRNIRAICQRGKSEDSYGKERKNDSFGRFVTRIPKITDCRVNYRRLLAAFYELTFIFISLRFVASAINVVQRLGQCQNKETASSHARVTDDG